MQLVLAEAGSAVGGSWAPDFMAAGMADASLVKLTRLIDKHLLGGMLRQACRARGMPYLRCRVVDSWPGHDDWLSVYVEYQGAGGGPGGVRGNEVMFKRDKWGGVGCVLAKEVSEERPMSVEGCLCTSRLQVLAHILAHELVHALVCILLPDIDASSTAYLADERHGPIFRLLNRRLFGQGSNSFKHIF